MVKCNLKYQVIYADPPWEQRLKGIYRVRPNTRPKLPYSTMSTLEICTLPIPELADNNCHLWLWTTNQFLHDGFHVLKAWGFKYLAPITWVKQSGTGNYFIHRTQTLLFGYKGKCLFPLERYRPTVVFASNPTKHSRKPQCIYDLIESISPEPRIELFARKKRFGWDCWGNEVESDIEL